MTVTRITTAVQMNETMNGTLSSSAEPCLHIHDGLSPPGLSAERDAITFLPA